MTAEKGGQGGTGAGTFLQPGVEGTQGGWSR